MTHARRIVAIIGGAILALLVATTPAQAGGTHPAPTCPCPTSSSVAPTTATPTESPSVSPSVTVTTPAPSASPSAEATTPTPAPTTTPAGGLPVTGTPVGTWVSLGTGLLVLGVALWAIARYHRRRVRFTA